MAKEKNYRHNHYVPEWYQKRFMHPGQGKYWYLDLQPEVCESNGHRYTRRDLLRWGAKSCFAQEDLYTVKWGAYENVDIEKFFFGEIDPEGECGVSYFADFDFHRSGFQRAHQNLLRYMSVQKLRTPKGLGDIKARSGARHRLIPLGLLQRLQYIFCAIWSECVWQIADASGSDTKFIISDHPVTVYNRRYFPASKFCKGFSDPDIRLVATHTYFPLSIDKILILTNLAWARNPYQKEDNLRPNPEFFRSTIFKMLDIQTYRSLSEQEVMEINYITKKRALRYVAGADKEWLYPEKYLRSTHWSKFGDGLLFMPEPRDLHMGGEVMVGYKDGSSDAWNEYGQKPWEEGYKDNDRFKREADALERFKLEWAVRQGPEYRGTSDYFHHGNDGPYITPDKFHQRDLERARELHAHLKRKSKR